MKNANMPAAPMGKGADERYFCANDLGDGWSEQCKPAFGFTKREAAALKAMQGILSNPNYSYDGFGSMSKIAVEAADALLAELDKTQSN